MMNYEMIKALAKELRRPVPRLLALDRNNDPFYWGTPQDKIDGQWFFDCWQMLGYSTGVHIRRMHYALASTNPRVTLPGGTPYENTLECWEYLNDASKAARYLEYVDPGAFVDRRNEEPLTIHQSYARHEVEISLRDIYEPRALELSFPDIPNYSLDSFTSPQRYHLEIWCEKSTMNDIFIPLVQRYSAVLMFGKGELSITMALEAVRRFERAQKSVRIFYVSDFDPAGMCMPVSMARKVEYFIHKHGLDLDVRLFPTVLTAEQVKHYTNLLPTPIKKDERRKQKFEDRFGSGNGGNVAVELDALEALYPGELRRILREELSRYYDDDLSRRILVAEGDAIQELEGARDVVYARHSAELAAIEQEEETLRMIFEKQLKERMASHTQRKYELSQVIRDEMPYITEANTPEADEAVERDYALFDSSRDYLTQNEVYQRHKGNVTEEEDSA